MDTMPGTQLMFISSLSSPLTLPQLHLSLKHLSIEGGFALYC
jgi:hypothetical protein